MHIELRDAKMMFEGCILMFEGEPAFIVSVDREHAIIVVLTEGKKKVVCHNKFESFQPIQQRLGFINDPESRSAIYVQRKPVRQFKVGVTAKNIRAFGIGLDEDNFFDTFPKWKGLVACLRNLYPSFREAVDSVTNDDYNSVAFDKQFAVAKNHEIFYKNRAVGRVDGYTPTLLPRYGFLKEHARW